MAERLGDAPALRVVPGLPTAELGESPWWDDETQQLYWVDITGGTIHRWRPSDGRSESWSIGGEIGFAMLDRSARVVAGLGGGIYAMEFGSDERTLVAQPDMHSENRFNDAACDPRGRLWAGTMHRQASRDRPSTGALYRLIGAEMDCVEPDIAIANGLGWSPGGDTMYFADTHRGIVWAYAYDLNAGVTGPRRPFAEVPRADGVPDGLAVDSLGRVFVVLWRGGRINVYAPDGQLAGAIATPVAHPTSCCFGGADRRTLFVTTARNGLSPAEATRDELSGRVFATAVDVPGLPSTRAALDAAGTF